MKLVRAVLPLALLTLGLLSNVANADTIPGDPQLIIRGGGGSTQVFENTFGFSSNGSQCGFAEDCVFQNVSGENWDTLRFQIFTPVPVLETVSCGFDAFFGGCQVIRSEDNQTFTIEFFGGSGISTAFCEGDFCGSEGEFLIDITAPEGGNLWPNQSGFSATANVPTTPIPEPASVALLLTGAGMLAWKRRQAA